MPAKQKPVNLRLPLARTLLAATLAACDVASMPSGAAESGSSRDAMGSTVSINAGGSATGVFGADAYFSGGNTYSTTNTINTSQITGTVPPQAVFQTERYGEFTYTIPNLTPSSTQTVTLYFQESYWTVAGQRTFNVAINGATVLTAFDIFAAAGGSNRAISRTFTTTASSSGQVVIQFSRGGGPDNPKVCGITLVEGGSGGGNLAVFGQCRRRGDRDVRGRRVLLGREHVLDEQHDRHDPDHGCGAAAGRAPERALR